MPKSIVMASGLILALSVLSWWLTGKLMDYAVRISMLDTPNARSSHTVATPRGGGVAIVVVVMLALVILGAAGTVDGVVCIAIGGSGAMVALIGFVDDLGHIPAKWRLLGHFFSAAWCLVWLSAGHPLGQLFAPAPSWLGYIVLVFTAVWLLNLYNFMDGIDGIAGTEAVIAGMAGGVMLWRLGEPGMAVVAFAIAGASLGFLVWNFPPARIFMGDSGSGFLGFVFAAVAFWTASAGAQVFAAWLIFLGTFVVDAGVTLCRRLMRRERVWEAHRSHAYQRLSRHLGAHRPVTLAYSAVTLCWLVPIGFTVGTGLLSITAGLVLSYTPLLACAWRLGGGLADDVPISRRSSAAP
jgi:Fuc2NAc and GlcNAc transferase